MKINLSTLTIVYLGLLFILLYSGSINIYNSAVLLYTLSAAYITGAAIIPRSLNTAFMSFTHGLTAMLVGALVFSLAIFFTVNVNVLLALMAIAVAICLFFNKGRLSFKFTFSLPDVVLTSMAFLIYILISRSELKAQLSAVTLGCIDNYDTNFFTSIVTSFRTGTLTSAAYETGSPVPYQDLGFFIPAFLANILKITSHQALWGLAQPMYKLLALLLGYEVFFAFFKEKVTRSNYLFMVAAILFPLLLAPLHPLYVAKLNVHNFIFSGMGYLQPAGTVTYPIAIVTVLLSLVVFKWCNWETGDQIRPKLFFAVVMGVMIIAKVPMYFAFFTFLCSIILVRVVFRKEKVMNYLPYIMASLMVTAVAFKLCLGYPSLTRTSIHYGYLIENFAHLYNRSAVGAKNNIIILALILITYLVWLGIRLIGIIGLVRADRGKLADISVGVVLSLLATTLVALFLRIQGFDIRGLMQRDGTFDVEQFVRSSFYLATIAGGIGLFNIILNSEKQKISRIIAATSVVWCLLAFTTIISLPVGKKQQDPWFTDNYATLRSGKLNDGLIVVDPYKPSYGIMLSACDYGTYWTVMGLSPVGYNTCPKNAYRWDMYAQLIAKPDEALFNAFKKENVRYVISIPEDKDKLDQAAALFPARLKKSTYSSWVYELQ